MDRGDWRARTDNIVVVEPARRRLLWVPRDMWVDEIRERINVAFAQGGHDALARGLAGFGIRVDHSVCLRREAVERALSNVHVRVAVRKPLELWYPLAPQAPIEEGRKPIDFRPPAEILNGERLHQWIGARFGRTGSSSDLDRIRRQAVLLRTLLREHFDFNQVLAERTWVSLSSPAALDELRRVRPWWRFRCFGPVAPMMIEGKEVLVQRARRCLPRQRGKFHRREGDD